MRSPRYALAIVFVPGVVAAGVLGLQECDNPVCVKISAATEPHQHVVSGSQGDNMERMARMRRGGGRYAVRRFDSRGFRGERSVALREAVRHGWEATAVQAALLGDQATLWSRTSGPLESVWVGTGRASCVVWRAVSQRRAGGGRKGVAVVSRAGA